MPDERELNMILNMVTSIKPKDEMQAALAAQMVAVHLMTMKVAERCLALPGFPNPQLFGVAGKLARTFAMQTEALSKLQGRKTSRQKITIRYEKHEHQHVHMHRGEEEIEEQPHAAMEGRIVGDGDRGTVPGQDAPEGSVSLSSRQGDARVSDARRKRLRSAKGSR